MKLSRFTNTLRYKLVFSSLVIQIVFISLLISNSLNLVEDGLVRQSEVRISELERLLNTSLASPFVQQDYEFIQEILDDSIQQDAILWLSVYDSNNGLIVEAGERRSQPNSKHTTLSKSIHDDHTFFHSAIPIEIYGIEYGSLHYDISLKPIIDTKTALLDLSLIISIAGVILTALALFFTGMWLTRNLSILTTASESLSEGNLQIRIEMNSNDEVKYLADAFNAMAETLQRRIHDLHESQDAQEVLLAASQQERARLTSLLSVMTRGILFETLDAKVAYYNPAFFRIFRFKESDILNGRLVDNLAKAITPSLKNREQPSNLLNMSVEERDVELELVDGTIIIQRCYPVADDHHNITGTLWIFEDVTAERKTAAQLIHLAEHDSLTGLFNRRKFQEETQHLLDISLRHKRELALVFFDIDDFKYINDGFGHKFGDEVLFNVASAAGRLIRKEEYLFRLGGDEFAILLPDANMRDACMLADRILNAISSIVLNYKNKRIHITSSIGISLFPLHARSTDELLACADIAMYQAKNAGKNTYRVYRSDSSSTVDMYNRASWDSIIHEALNEGNITLHYQGVYSADTRELLYFEALARIITPSMDSDNLPGQFIPYAEQSGKILDIDRLVIKASIEKLASTPDIPRIGVNISGRSFDDPSLENYIITVLNDYSVEPQRLLIELTETAAVSDLQDAQRFIKAMRRHGCRVALDDFGSGYSSFVYLKHLQADFIKIDGLFMQNFVTDKENQLFVQAIVDIAHGLNRKVIAEFVEDKASLEILTKMGVDYAQGYYLGKPSVDTEQVSEVAV